MCINTKYVRIQSIALERESVALAGMQCTAIPSARPREHTCIRHKNVHVYAFTCHNEVTDAVFHAPMFALNRLE